MFKGHVPAALESAVFVSISMYLTLLWLNVFDTTLTQCIWHYCAKWFYPRVTIVLFGSDEKRTQPAVGLENCSGWSQQSTLSGCTVQLVNVYQTALFLVNVHQTAIFSSGRCRPLKKVQFSLHSALQFCYMIKWPDCTFQLVDNNTFLAGRLSTLSTPNFTALFVMPYCLVVECCSLYMNILSRWSFLRWDGSNHPWNTLLWSRVGLLDVPNHQMEWGLQIDC